jgi:hypothetical protein
MPVKVNGNSPTTEVKSGSPTLRADLEREGNGGDAPKKSKIRTGDKSDEALVIPKNRIFIVFIGLMLSVFLAALDQTIVCMFRFSCAVTNK